MTIRHLKIFLAVADTGKMSAAAEKLFITQPSVSQAIRELEQHYQLLLFERLSKKLFITEAGKLFYTYSKQVVSQFDRMEEHMCKDSLREKLRIGATITVGDSILSYIVKDFRVIRPDVDVYSYVGNTRVIEQKLLNMELDVGIVEGQMKHHDLITLPLVEDFLVLACAKDHPFYNRETVSTADLINQEFVIRESGSGTRELFENYLDKHHIKIKIVFEENTPSAIIKAVTINNCLTVISARLVEEKVREGSIRIFMPSNKEWYRHFSYVYHKDKFLGASFQTLKSLVDSHGFQQTISNMKAGRLIDII